MDTFPDTLEEVVQKSIQLEKEGRDFYLESAKKVKNSVGKRTLERLANDELIHISRFKELYEAVANKSVESLSVGDKNITTFDEIFNRLKEQLDDAIDELTEVGVDDAESLEMALDLENHTHLFYKRASEEMKDEKVKTLYRYLADEEKAHYDLLSKALDYLSDPSLYFGMSGKL
jgi:rubrerythrin